ncbi:MAG: CopG family transcriptional regulator [Acidimicrobiales bacterium]
MRTTIELDDDVVAAVDRIRQERSLGLSRAVNELIRAGLVAPTRSVPFRQRTHRMGLRMDVANVAEVLDLLDEGPEG